VLSTAHQGGREALEDPAIHELDGLEARFARVGVEVAYASQEGVRISELVRDEGQEGRVVRSGEELIGDPPQSREAVIVRQNLAVGSDDEQAVQHGLLLGLEDEVLELQLLGRGAQGPLGPVQIPDHVPLLEVPEGEVREEIG